MLEHQRLLLCPWSDHEETAARDTIADALPRREILDADTRQPLGQACRKQCRSRGWLDWFLRPALRIAVHETEDESLLFTMHRERSWWLLPAPKTVPLDQEPGSTFRWEIRDAEERGVGTLEPSHLAGYASSLQESADLHGSLLTLAYDVAGRCLLFARADEERRIRVLAREIMGATAWSEAGSFSWRPGGQLVEFSPALEGQPFSKMLILAAALTRV